MDAHSLLFQFANKYGVKETKFFSNPIKIITTNELDDVLPKMIEVQSYLEKGFYTAGYLSYEAAPAFDQAMKVKEGAVMPLLWFGVYNEPNHFSESEISPFTVSEWTSTTSKAQYSSGFEKIKSEIKSGNTYQVNYTMRLEAEFSGDDFAFYRQLEAAQNSLYSAYLHTGKYRILSASPELFFHWTDNEIVTKPMKGTVKRGKSTDEDQVNKEWLANSTKNKAENVMIVDLLRNDVSVVAENGSVFVPALYDVEKYPTVWQMTSTVKAKTKENTKILDIFQALFPCGSITGAPKVSTMNIIKELENTPREVYCGAIGYMTPTNEAIFNVPIRTVLIDSENGRAEYGVGGGVTWDSILSEEYEEAFLKAKLLTEKRPSFQLLESLRLADGEYFLLEYHVNRLLNAAHYFQFEVSADELQQSLIEFSEQNRLGTYKVRLTVSKNGTPEVSGTLIEEIKEVKNVRLAEKAIRTTTPFVFFKTTNRSMYDEFSKKDVFDVLLWNEKGEITEFTNGNIIIKSGGILYTPPVHCGLLAGTYRQQLLAQGEIQERVITKADLEEADGIWFINSVRKWVECKLLM